MKLEEEYKVERSNSSGTRTGYTVEARYSYIEAISIAGQIFDTRWKHVSFEENSTGGIPSPVWCRELREHGLYTYIVAQALRWWFHAVADANGPSMCLETRLVEHCLKTTHSVEATKYIQHIGEDQSVSNIMPIEE